MMKTVGEWRPDYGRLTEVEQRKEISFAIHMISGILLLLLVATGILIYQFDRRLSVIADDLTSVRTSIDTLKFYQRVGSR